MKNRASVAHSDAKGSDCPDSQRWLTEPSARRSSLTLRRRLAAALPLNGAKSSRRKREFR